jgi:hypothetical protein
MRKIPYSLIITVFLRICQEKYVIIGLDPIIRTLLSLIDSRVKHGNDIRKCRHYRLILLHHYE